MSDFSEKPNNIFDTRLLPYFMGQGYEMIFQSTKIYDNKSGFQKYLILIPSVFSTLCYRWDKTI